MFNREENLSLSLVIPCRNDVRRLPQTLDTLFQYLDQRPFNSSIEVLFSIEKSEDSTADFVRKKIERNPQCFILEHTEARGKGFNVRQGMLAASGECILFMDVDLSVPLHFIPRFLEQFSKRPELDILIASRRHPASRIRTPQPWIRRLGSKAINLAVQALAITSCGDTQCGFKAFRRSAAHRIFTQTKLDGFSFDLEVLALAKKMCMTVEEYPVEWSDVPGSSVQPFLDGVKMVRDAFHIRFGTLNIP